MNPVAIYHFLIVLFILIFVVYYDQKWRVFLGGTKSKQKVGRSVISTSRRELGWILVLLQECYQFALWRPLAAAAAQV